MSWNGSTGFTVIVDLYNSSQLGGSPRGDHYDTGRGGIPPPNNTFLAEMTKEDS